MNSVIEGYVQDYVYENFYVKKRMIAGMMNCWYFFIAIFSGIMDSVMRFIYALIALLISITRLNVPCLPSWIIKYKYLDDFHKAYMSYVYMQHAHNNPVVNTVAAFLVNSVNKRKARLEEVRQKLKQMEVNGVTSVKQKELFEFELEKDASNIT